jgi:uncharacterized protein with GYD domain
VIRRTYEQETEEFMAIYITQGRYTPDAVKGMVAKPEDREKAVADLMEKAGAKLLALYFTFGEYDVLAITEAPSEEVMASALIAVAASGGLSHLRTSVAMTAKDAMKAFKSAGALSKSFKPPGR